LICNVVEENERCSREERDLFISCSRNKILPSPDLVMSIEGGGTWEVMRGGEVWPRAATRWESDVGHWFVLE
jgi:hypothetical protein